MNKVDVNILQGSAATQNMHGGNYTFLVHFLQYMPVKYYKNWLTHAKDTSEDKAGPFLRHRVMCATLPFVIFYN